jgi:O-antigen/teichoic acid export membrane protein
MPLGFLMQPVNRVLFPAMASVQGQEARLRRGYLAAVRLASLAAFPLMVGLWGTADVLVPLAYGEAWRGAVPILQWLVVAGACRVILTVNNVVLQSQGRMRSQALWNGVWLGLVGLCSLIGSAWGVVGVAVGFGLATALCMVLLTAVALRLTGVRWGELVAASYAGLMATLATGLVMTVWSWPAGGVGPWAELLLRAACGGVAYLVAVRLCLTGEDRRFLGSVCRGLPAWVSGVIARLFGVPSIQGGVP